MGLVYRCSNCDKEMVLESFHCGRVVRCPHCRSRNAVPESLDFQHASEATLKDVNRGGLLLFFGIAASVTTCAPVTAAVWWFAVGAVQRAKEEEREVEPSLVWAKWIAVLGTVIAVVAWAMIGMAAL